MTTDLVLGLGGTVDYEIAWDPAVLEALVGEYGITRAELSSTLPVDSERDLVVTLLAFLERGAGGERFVASSGIVEQFAARFSKEITLGGTPVRAAIAMEVIGVPATVHLVSIDDHVRRLLPASTAYLCSADHDTLDPHLIVQFPRGTRVRAGDVDITAPHPNRLIYANDPPNRELVLSEDLGRALTGASVFLVSGFNVIQDPDLLAKRLFELKEHLRQLPPAAVVLYEDSGFHVPALNRLVREELVDAVDVWSLNEDELQGYLGRDVDLLDVADVARALDDVHALIPASTLVVHTKHWSLARGAGAADWTAALQGGITMASTRYLHGDGFTADDHARTGLLPRQPAGERLARGLEAELGVLVRCVPAFVLETDTPTTIGLGDVFVGGFVAALARP